MFSLDKPIRNIGLCRLRNPVEAKKTNMKFFLTKPCWRCEYIRPKKKTDKPYYRVYYEYDSYDDSKCKSHDFASKDFNEHFIKYGAI